MKKEYTMKRILPATLAILLMLVPLSGDDARSIMEKSEELKQPDTVRSIAEMTIVKKNMNEKRTLRLAGMKKGNDEKVLLEIVEPYRMKVLTHTRDGGDDLQWIKMQNGMVKQIAAGDRSNAFENSHLFYEDLRSRDIDEYTYRLMGTKTVQGKECYQILATPKEGKSIYNRAVFYVITPQADSELAYFILQADIYYQGYKYKVLTNYDIKVVDGIITPYRSVMQKYDKEDNKQGYTEVTLKMIEYNSSEVTATMFHKSVL